MDQLLFIINSYFIRFVKNWSVKNNLNLISITYTMKKKRLREVQGVPQSQTAALPRHQEEEETNKSKQAQIEQTYEKH